MPVFKQRASVLARGMEAFLNLEAGLIRDGNASEQNGAHRLKLAGQKAARRKERIVSQSHELGRIPRKLTELRAMLGRNGDEAGGKGVRPENIVWIFGTGRSGNTWLSSMMGELRGCAVWSEPSIGKLFGEFYYFGSREGQRKTNNFVLGEKQKDTWLRSIRNFVLDGANGRFPELGNGYLVVKEQVGSVGAPLLMEALPESRMVLLVRDPRDVVASITDATRKGGWRYARLDESDPERNLIVAEDSTAFARERASHYLKNVGKAKEAYDAHQGRKALVKYEDLRADTLRTIEHICSKLEIKVEEEDLEQVVAKHAWENLPKEEKGEGKFHRKASPGSWREDLTPEQAEVVERITAPLLNEFYPGSATAGI
jgi:hypothetical protein